MEDQEPDEEISQNEEDASDVGNQKFCTSAPRNRLRGPLWHHKIESEEKPLPYP
jgi:hypothetical protein